MKKLSLLLTACMLAAAPVMAGVPAQPTPQTNNHIVKAQASTDTAVKKNHKKKGKKVGNKKHSKKAAAAPVTDNSAGPQ